MRDRTVRYMPKRPYCTDELGGLVIYGRDKALLKKYVQLNHPHYKHCIVLDIDRYGAVLAWNDANFHAPNFSIKNRNNAHAHLVYFLKYPVCTTSFAHLKMIRYCAAIESSMIEKMDADRGYAGLIAKNPLSHEWDTWVWEEIHEYTLDELADSLDLIGHPKRNREAFGLGRNCQMFDDVRHWAYKNIKHYWSPNYYNTWLNAIEHQCDQVNNGFYEPLPMSEIRAISKSIARWTYKHLTPSGLSEWHSKRGAKGGRNGSKESKTFAGKAGCVIKKAEAGAKGGAIGGKVSKGGGRAKGSVKADSIAQQKPWESLGISRKTYYKRKKLGTL